MKCKVCGNTRHFLTEVKEFRIMDSESPNELRSYVIPIIAHCISKTCTATSKNNDIEFDPIPSVLSQLTDHINSYRND